MHAMIDKSSLWRDTEAVVSGCNRADVGIHHESSSNFASNNKSPTLHVQYAKNHEQYIILIAFPRMTYAQNSLAFCWQCFSLSATSLNYGSS